MTQPLVHLKDYVCDSNIVSCHYPIEKYMSLSNLSLSHQAYIMSLSSETKPSNYVDASEDPRWTRAMKEEIEALNNNHTWEFVDLSHDASTIGSKWVYKIKRHVDGTIEIFKAWLVAQGFNQTEGLDYHETFSPVAKLTTIRVLLALAAIHG